MAFSEADTHAKLIDSAIHASGWPEDMICRETTLRAVETIGGKARRRTGTGGRTDYTLRVRVSSEAQPVAVVIRPRTLRTLCNRQDR